MSKIVQSNSFTSLSDLQIPGLIQPGFLSSSKNSPLAHAPLTGPQTYYRSKSISTTNSINPLIAAATALFAFITQLQTVPVFENGQIVYQDLTHEIKAFETQAHTQGYRSEIILLARYILCATLDELILISPWGDSWHKHKLLATFHGEDWGGERFFIILERLSADPVIYIDVLELIYLCLSLGYAGKYRTIESDQTELAVIIEKLYQCIYWQRGDICKELAIAEPPVATQPLSAEDASPHTKQQPLPIWLLAIFTLMLILTIYVGFSFMLNSSITPIYQQLTALLQNYANH